MTDAPARSLADLLRRRVEATPDRVAFLVPAGSGWREVTWAAVGAEVRAIACGLRALGLAPEQRGAILSATRLEWILCDLAVLCAGGATTTIYPSNTAEDCAFILRDSGCRVAFVENEEQLDKLREVRDDLPELGRAVVIDGGVDDGWAMPLAALTALGREWDAAHPGELERGADAVRPASLATLVYTSGTTGRPKGVELPHDCWLYEAAAIDELGLLRADDVQYLWLPLSHIFGKVLEAAQLQIGFTTAVDGRVDKLVENLAAVRPTFVAAVPRIFEKVHAKVLAGAQEAGGLKLRLFRWAMGVGREASKLVQQRRPLPVWLSLRHRIADRLVLSRLRERFGGRLRFFVSGSAPLAREVAEFFHAAGVLILEGYGLTESSAASFVNLPQSYRFGTVGPPLPGTEVRIAPADGEILLRGRGVMRGYHGLPEATAEALDRDGWLHTGDIGELDADGFLRITDRKKDLIKTSGGKYVAPQELEGRLKALCPQISQVLVHGNGRNFCSALVTLDEEATRKWLGGQGEPDAGRPLSELAAAPAVRRRIEEAVDALNGGLASFETIKKFAILPAEFTLEAGELTPSLKMKRKVIETRHRELLDSFYGAPRA